MTRTHAWILAAALSVAVTATAQDGTSMDVELAQYRRQAVEYVLRRAEVQPTLDPTYHDRAAAALATTRCSSQGPNESTARATGRRRTPTARANSTAAWPLSLMVEARSQPRWSIRLGSPKP